MIRGSLASAIKRYILPTASSLRRPTDEKTSARLCSHDGLAVVCVHLCPGSGRGPHAGPGCRESAVDGPGGGSNRAGGETTWRRSPDAQARRRPLSPVYSSHHGG